MTQADLFDSPAIPLDLCLDDLPAAERRVLTALLSHRGRGNALGGQSLALAAAIEGSARSVRRAVGALRRKRGVAVCSSLRRGEAGYYLADSADELEEAAAWLVRLGLKILSAAARMKKKTLAEFMGQLRLDEIAGGGEDAHEQGRTDSAAADREAAE